MSLLRQGGGVNAHSFMSLIFMSLSLRGGGCLRRKVQSPSFCSFFLKSSLTLMMILSAKLMDMDDNCKTLFRNYNSKGVKIRSDKIKDHRHTALTAMWTRKKKGTASDW